MIGSSSLFKQYLMQKKVVLIVQLALTNIALVSMPVAFVINLAATLYRKREAYKGTEFL
jgi:hypothetical protein